MNIKQALADWRAIPGEITVIDDKDVLQSYADTTFAAGHGITAVIRPENKNQLPAVLDIANRHNTPLYPISGGKNWGLGSRLPVGPGQVVLDLGRLNRIVEYNAKHGYLIVEPGVTFIQAYEYLNAKGAKHFIAATGGAAEGSLIGNIVERGDAAGPYGDRVATMSALEVILPNGETITSDHGVYNESKTAFINRHGVGPAFSGLFTQSNFGIVTQAAVWLHPYPKTQRYFVCQTRNLKALPLMVDALQSLVEQHVLQSHCVSIWNGCKLLARNAQLKDLSEQEYADQADAWYASGSIYTADDGIADAALNTVHRYLLPYVSSFDVLSSADQPELVKEVFAGRPTDQNIHSTYWRKQTAAPEDKNPDRDGCGVIWLCPAVPFNGEDFAGFATLAAGTIRAQGFEANIGAHVVSAKQFNSFIALMYDRDQPEQDDKAMQCHNALWKKLLAAGFPPYRLGIQSMELMNTLPAANAGFLRAIKNRLDPNNILAPGRYLP
ncbi:MAG: FAD-binding oxidoreductase [Gammaproteobacteria bacterium]|nr:FAD-binding oxidoreductase [Gammaproteobacteria bacterium]